jgi:hypothetical protein
MFDPSGSLKSNAPCVLLHWTTNVARLHAKPSAAGIYPAITGLVPDTNQSTFRQAVSESAIAGETLKLSSSVRCRKPRRAA